MAIKNYMTVTGKEKEQVGVFDVKVTHSKAVLITDENVIPAPFRVAQPDKIDKAGLRKALLAGEDVAGAELTVNDNINIK